MPSSCRISGGTATARRVHGAGKDTTLAAGKMSPQQQLPLMVTEDMMAIKAFLWERNNAGELNIDKLCIVGAEMGASVAVNFAAADAAQQDENLVYGADREYKLGRFVKVLVLISPEQAFRGLPIRAALKEPVVQHDIAIMILVGKQDSKWLEEAKQIHALLRSITPSPRTTRIRSRSERSFFSGPTPTCKAPSCWTRSSGCPSCSTASRKAKRRSIPRPRFPR